MIARANTPASGPGQAPSPLIRNLPTPVEDDVPRWERLVPAWIVSGVIHIVLLSLFLLVTVGGGNATNSQYDLSLVGNVESEDDARHLKLTNTDLGTDPNNEFNLPVDNIGDKTVVGVDLTVKALPGMPGAPDEMPPVLTAPPGSLSGIGVGPEGQPTEGRGAMQGLLGPRGGGSLERFTYNGRNPMTRQKVAAANGGSAKSERAVALGLSWLARHQADDGHWSLHDFCAHGKCNCAGNGVNNDVAATSLALLALLGAGETPRGSARSTLYSKHVERGIKWLISRQGTDGRFGEGYSHGMASIAICEAFGMTSDPQYRAPAQRAVTCCVNWQGPGGGFRYGPKQQGDLSVSGWHIQALKSGQMAGLNVPNNTLAGVNDFLDHVAIPDGSGYGYTDPQQTVRMTAVGLLSRQYMGWGDRNPSLLRGVENLRRVPPSPAFKDIYYYYYATQVLHQVHGEAWEQWNYGANGRPGMRDLLIDTQDQGNGEKRDQKGSWDPTGDAFGPQLGRLGVTALSILTLEVYYRHLPTYQRQLSAQKDEQIRNK